VWRRKHDNMFSRFDTIPACDGRTDEQTDGQTDVQPIAITCFSIADARKNWSPQVFAFLNRYNICAYRNKMGVCGTQ